MLEFVVVLSFIAALVLNILAIFNIVPIVVAAIFYAFSAGYGAVRAFHVLTR